MSDLTPTAEADPARNAGGEPSAVRRFITRLSDWFTLQSPLLKTLVVLTLVLIPATGIYSWTLWQKQSVLSADVRAMAAAQPGSEALWALNDKLPVVFGTGSLLGFLESHPIERITVVYRPLLWNVSERLMLVESQGRQHAFYPSDMETKIFSDKAVTAAWGARLAFVPRGEVGPAGTAMLERLDERFANARPQGEKDGWKASMSALLSGALTLGLLGFLAVQLRSQFKSLKFTEPSQISGSIDDLVGMDDIKAEVAQIKDQYQRRADYAQYGIKRPFNVMFSGPAGTGKTRLASCLARELNLPILFHFRRQPGDGLRGGRLGHAVAHRRTGQAAPALHRVPGRGAGPVHEARRPPQVRRRHAEHAAGHPGRRADQVGRRDHLDRRVQLQQREHADGRSHAAPLPDEGGLPHAQQGRAARHHRPLPGPARVQGAWRPGPGPPGGPDRRPQPRRHRDHRQPGGHQRRAGRHADRHRHPDAGRRAGAGGQRQQRHDAGPRSATATSSRCTNGATSWWTCSRNANAAATTGPCCSATSRP
jgi:hypothetical protein